MATLVPSALTPVAPSRPVVPPAGGSTTIPAACVQRKLLYWKLPEPRSTCTLPTIPDPPAALPHETDPFELVAMAAGLAPEKIPLGSRFTGAFNPGQRVASDVGGKQLPTSYIPSALIPLSEQEFVPGKSATAWKPVDRVQRASVVSVELPTTMLPSALMATGPKVCPKRVKCGVLQLPAAQTPRLPLQAVLSAALGIEQTPV